MAEDLLDEEGVALGGPVHLFDEALRGSLSPRFAQQASHAGRVQGLDRDPLRQPKAGESGQHPHEGIARLRYEVPVRAHHQHTHARQVRRQVLEQQQSRVVRPVQVVEQHHQRALLADASQQRQHTVEEEAPLLLGWQFHGRREIGDPAAQLGYQPRDLRSVLGQQPLEVVGGELPCQLLEDLDRRHEGRAALLVGAPGHAQEAPLLGFRQELLRQPRLADTGLAAEEDEPTPPAAGLLDEAQESCAFPLAAHQRRARQCGFFPNGLEGGTRSLRPTDHVAHLADRRRSERPVLLEAALQQGPHDSRGIGGQRFPRGFPPEDRRQDVDPGRALEGAPSGQALEEHASEGPHVGGRVHVLSARLLGTHVGRRPEHDALTRGHGGELVPPALDRFRQSQVQELHAAVRRDTHVRGLQVAMDDPRRVGGDEPLRDLAADGQRLFGAQRPPFQSGGEVLARHEFHGDEARVPDLSDVEDLRDVRVVERGEGLRLPLEAPQPLLVVRELLGQDLDRHLAFEARVLGPIDLAHASGPEGTDDLVVRQGLAGDEGHGGRKSLATATPVHSECLSWRPPSVVDATRCGVGSREGSRPQQPRWFGPRHSTRRTETGTGLVIMSYRGERAWATSSSSRIRSRGSGDWIR